jgi:hypothetical protein
MTLRDLISTNTAAGGPLTEDDLLRAFDALKRVRRRGCPPHLVAASAKPGSIIACADCGCPVRIPRTWMA